MTEFAGGGASGRGDGASRGLSGAAPPAAAPKTAPRRLLLTVASLLDRLADALAPPGPRREEIRLIVSRGTVTWSSHAARAMFGAAAKRGATVDDLRAALARDAPGAAAPFDALIAEGVAFTMVDRVAGRGAYWFAGGPVGAGCELRVVDVGGISAGIEEAKAAAARSEAEAAATRQALDLASLPVWRTDAAGETLWRNAVAAGHGSPPSDADGGRRIEAPQGGALIVGRAESPGEPTALVLRRFVETVTETFAHLRIGMAIYDSERRLTLANPAVSDLFGLDSGWLAARPTLRDTLDRLRERRMLPEQLDYPAWRARLFTLFDQGGATTYDERWELPDQRVIHVLGKPHPLGGIAFVFEDISAAIEMERWRRTALKTRRSMLDAMLDGVVEFSTDGTTRMANPAFLALWGLGEGGEGAPRHVADFAGACRPLAPEPPIWDLVRDAVSNLSGQAPRSHRIRLKDGRVLIARIAKMPDGKTLAAFTDVTDSSRVAEALRERAASLEAADAIRTATLYQISHGLRTPLNAVIGFADLLAEAPESARTEYLKAIREAARALTDGVERLTELVATGSPSVEEQHSAMMATPALRGAVGVLDRRLREVGARVEMGGVPEGATARGDPARIRQLIFAMVSEAVANAGPGDVLRIGGRQMDGMLELWCEAPRLDPGEPPSEGFRAARATAEIHGAVLALDPDGDFGPCARCRLPGGVED